MSYAVYDFTESLSRVGVQAVDIERVVSAWGKGNESEEGIAHYRHSEDTGTEWSGGFLCALRDGSFVYITGWCDYTGWGCQDGASVYRFGELPTRDVILAAAKDEYGDVPPDSEWDTEPADLNRWLSAAAAGEA